MRFFRLPWKTKAGARSNLVENAADLLVGFSDAERAVVRITPRASSLSDARLASLAFSLFSLRMWNNLRDDNPIAQRSARTLLHAKADDLVKAGEFVRKLPSGGVEGAPPEQLRIQVDGEPKMRNEGVIEKRRGNVDGGEATVYTLHLEIKGFGLLGNQIDYYAAASIYALLQRASDLARNEVEREQLDFVVRATSAISVNGGITGRNEGVVATSIFHAAAEDEDGYVNEGVRRFLASTPAGLLGTRTKHRASQPEHE